LGRSPGGHEARIQTRQQGDHQGGAETRAPPISDSADPHGDHIHDVPEHLQHVALGGDGEVLGVIVALGQQSPHVLDDLIGETGVG